MQEYFDFLQQNMILVLVWVSLVVMITMSIANSATAAYKVIATQQLTTLINKENGVVADIRTKEEFISGHIMGSIHILPSEIKSNSFGELEKHKTNPVIVVCKSGQTASSSANALAKAGFENVFLLKEGLIAWKEGNMPLVKGKK